MPDFVSHACLQYFLFRTFVAMIYWTSTVKCCWVLLLPWIQLCFLLTLSKVMFFERLVLIPLVLYLICSVSAEGSLNCISCIRFRCSFFWTWVNQNMVYGFDSISTGQFSGMVCSISAEGSLNCVAHFIWMVLLLTLNKPFLFILSEFDACLPLSSA